LERENKIEPSLNQLYFHGRQIKQAKAGRSLSSETKGSLMRFEGRQIPVPSAKFLCGLINISFSDATMKAVDLSQFVRRFNFCGQRDDRNRESVPTISPYKISFVLNY
jgi:hypothetical protein